MAFSPDSKLLAAAGDGQEIRVWSMATGKEAGLFTGHEGTIRCLAFSPDGRRLASAGKDTTILVWDATGLSP